MDNFSGWTIFASIFFGVVAGLITHYVTTPIDQILSHYSKRYKLWLEQRREKFSEEVCFILAYPEMIAMTAQRENRAWLRAIFMLILSVVMLLSVHIEPWSLPYKIFTFSCTLLVTLLALLSFTDAMNYARLFSYMESLRRDIIADEETPPDQES